MSQKSEVIVKAKRAKNASYIAAVLSSETRNKVLTAIAEKINGNRENIKKVNQKDMENGKINGLTESLLDRLLLDDERIDSMITGIMDVVTIEDKLGHISGMIKRPNGLMIGQMYSPLGTIAIIYESRPNVTVDATVLCIKSGNTIILRGGSEAIYSNVFLTKLMQSAAYENSFPVGGIEIIENPDRKLVDELVQQRDFIDVLIPRGGAKFIKHIMNIAKIPTIETGAGNCHTYVDKNADLEMALEIVYNGKVQRPSVCNATKKVLVHKMIADKFLPLLKEKLDPAGVIYLTDENTQKYFPESELSTSEEWYEEFLDMRLGIKIIESLEKAIFHINDHSSHHTEAIVTEDYGRAMKFINAIDSSSLFWNASTRFTDGAQFGLGAEIGISTQKLHWRGPMSVYQLMSKKFVTLGNGQIRE